ncbi:MAG: PocR ligand-binding domain-containing protein [Chloroflexota bacterium]
MNELITSKQVQELLQVDRITVYRMVNDGRLKGVKVGNQWRFQRQDIERLMAVGTKDKDFSVAAYAPSEVLPVHCIQVIQDVFAEMNGVGSITTSPEGQPVTELSNSCDFCELIYSSPSGRQACITSWKELAQTPKGDPKFFKCHAGFQYARGRIELKGELTAIQVAGQFYNTAPPQSEIDQRVRELSEKHDINFEDLSKASKSLRILSSVRQSELGAWLKKVANTFEIIAQERADLLGRLKNIAAMSSFDSLG